MIETEPRVPMGDAEREPIKAFVERAIEMGVSTARIGVKCGDDVYVVDCAIRKVQHNVTRESIPGYVS